MKYTDRKNESKAEREERERVKRAERQLKAESKRHTRSVMSDLDDTEFESDAELESVIEELVKDAFIAGALWRDEYDDDESDDESDDDDTDDESDDDESDDDETEEDNGRKVRKVTVGRNGNKGNKNRSAERDDSKTQPRHRFGGNR